MENLELYNKLRAVPQEAKKSITAGRLKGFTDINPMWRIKALTEAFGPCGIGWWYEITDKRLEGNGNEIRAFVDINLYYRYGDTVSKPIPGTGGASFLTMERNGAYTSDECYKMALTDAISVAAKHIGVAADVYYEKDRDKYTPPEQQTQLTQQPAPQRPQQPQPQQQVRNQEALRQQQLSRQQSQQQAPKQPRQAPPPPDVQPGPEEAEDGYYYCKDCGQIITDVRLQNGQHLSPKEVAVMGMQNFGDQICYNCGAARMKARRAG